MLAGVPGGSDGIDVYDAACIALADLDEDVRATQFSANLKGSVELHERLGLVQRQVQDDPTTPTIPTRGGPPSMGDARPVQSSNPDADLAALRETLATPRSQRNAAE